MTLDNIFQPHFADVLDGSGQFIDITIHEVRQWHESIPGKQDAILLDQDGNVISTMTGSGCEDQVLLANFEGHFTIIESQVRVNEFDRLESKRLLFGGFECCGAFVGHHLRHRLCARTLAPGKKQLPQEWSA